MLSPPVPAPIRKGCWNLLAPHGVSSRDPDALLEKLGIASFMAHQAALEFCETVRAQDFQGCLRKTSDADRCLKRQMELLQDKKTFQKREFTNRRRVTANEFFRRAQALGEAVPHFGAKAVLVGLAVGLGWVLWRRSA